MEMGSIPIGALVVKPYLASFNTTFGIGEMDQHQTSWTMNLKTFERWMNLTDGASGLPIHLSLMVTNETELVGFTSTRTCTSPESLFSGGIPQMTVDRSSSTE